MHTRAAGEAWRMRRSMRSHSLRIPSLAPDLTVLLDAPVALGLARAGARQGSADRFEAERHEFFERVRSAYLERARLEPGRVRIIDAAGTIDEVGSGRAFGTGAAIDMSERRESDPEPNRDAALAFGGAGAAGDGGRGRSPAARAPAAGPAGVGKERFAAALAAALLCTGRGARLEACHVCAECALTGAGSHPDLHWLRRPEDRKTISVDQVRELAERLSMTSMRRGRRLAIVSPAHAMTINAQNALLKTLEEPAAANAAATGERLDHRRSCRRCAVAVSASSWRRPGEDLARDLAHR